MIFIFNNIYTINFVTVFTNSVLSVISGHASGVICLLPNYDLHNEIVLELPYVFGAYQPKNNFQMKDNVYTCCIFLIFYYWITRYAIPVNKYHKVVA